MEPEPAASPAGQSPRLVLASASPRRKSLLTEAGYEFIIHASDLDEAALERPGNLPSDLAMRLAVAKTEAVAEKYPHNVVLGADTVVAFGDIPLGKPPDAAAARNMLALLEHTTHLVITAIAVVHQAAGHQSIGRVISAVRFRPLTEVQIGKYLRTDLWRGKAGGYGLQDGHDFIERVTGCRTNIVGLPMTTTRRLLREAGIEPTILKRQTESGSP